MTGDTTTQMTRLLNAASQGDREAQNALWSTIYNELRGLARAQLAREGSGCDMQPTALVSEVYLRLFGNSSTEWPSRGYFWASVAKAMRRILVDDARSRLRQKRGGGEKPGPLPRGLAGAGYDAVTVLAIDEALEKLRQNDERRAAIVELRYFTGLSIDETAKVLGVSSGTVDAAWRLARAWMHRELSKGDTTVTEQGGRTQ